MSDEDLAAFGFVRVEDGTFLLPPAASMRFIPIGRYLKLEFAFGNGNGKAYVVLHRSALKVVAAPPTSVGQRSASAGFQNVYGPSKAGARHA
jgi:hypothetical protein